MMDTCQGQGSNTNLCRRLGKHRQADSLRQWRKAAMPVDMHNRRGFLCNGRLCLPVHLAAAQRLDISGHAKQPVRV